MDWLDLLAVQGTLKSHLQHHSSKASILWCSAFFIVQLLHPYVTTGKTRALTRWTFVGKVMSLLFNMLSRWPPNPLRMAFLCTHAHCPPISTTLLLSLSQSSSSLSLTFLPHGFGFSVSVTVAHCLLVYVFCMEAPLLCCNSYVTFCL